MTYRRPMAYAKELVARRKAGERIGLLIVSLHDWETGKALALRPGAARVVLDIDMLPHEVDWSPCAALDCLLVGDCDASVFYAAALMALAGGAASLWGEFSGDVWRIERCGQRLYPHGFVAIEGPYVGAAFRNALDAHRKHSLMTRTGVYGSPIFDAARDAVIEQIFSPMADKAKVWLRKQHAQKARAA